MAAGDLQIEAYYSQSRAEMLPFLPPGVGRILDVGCGAGAFGKLAKDRRAGTEVWGIERHPEAGAAARTVLDSVLIGDALALLPSVPRSFFDCIALLDVLEHVAEPAAILKAIRPALAPGGRVVVSLPNVFYLPVLWQLLVHRDWRYADSGVMDRTHLRFFTKKSALRLFDDAEFRVLEATGINRIRPSARRYHLLNRLSLGFFAEAMFMQFAFVLEPRF